MKKFLLSLVTILCVTFTAIGASNTFYTEWNDDNANGYDTITVYKGTSFEWVINTDIYDLCYNIFTGEGRYEDECYLSAHHCDEILSGFNFTNDSKTITITGTATSVGICDMLVFVDPYHHTFVINVVDEPSVQTITNGGNLEFVPNGTATMYLCTGESFYFYISGLSDDGVMAFSEPGSGSVVTIDEWYDGYIAGTCGSEVGTWSGVITDHHDINDDMTVNFVVSEKPSKPEISSTEQSYYAGESYTFTANTQSTNVTYKWSIGSYPSGGQCEFVNGNTSQNTTINFSTPGSYSFYCTVTNGACSTSSEYYRITVEEPTQQDITYIAPDATLCKGGNMSYTISASGTITSTLTLVVGLESFTGYLKGDNNYIFDLSGMTPSSGSYTAEVMADGETVATATLTVATAPYMVIECDETTFSTGEQYTFTSSVTAETYDWNLGSQPEGGLLPEIMDAGQDANVTFNSAGQYELWCTVTDANGCTATNFMYVNVFGEDISDNCMSLYDYSGTERWEYYAQPTNLPVEVTKEGSKNDKVLYFNANAYERLTYALDLENDDDYATWMNILGSEDSRLVGRIYVESLGTDADGLALFLLSGDVSGGPSYHEKNAAFPITGLQTGQWFEFDIPLSTDNGWYYNTYSSTNEYKALWLSTYKGSEETLDAFKIYVDYLRICEKPFEVVAKSGKVSYDGSQVELKFTAPMSVPTSTSAITIKEGTETHTITSIQAKDGDQTVLIFNLETPISNASATITASLSQSTSAVKSIDGRPASEFNTIVTNLLGMRTTTGWYDDFADASDFTTSEISADGTYFVAIENATQSQLDVTSYGDVTWAGSLKLSTIKERSESSRLIRKQVSVT